MVTLAYTPQEILPLLDEWLEDQNFVRRTSPSANCHQFFDLRGRQVASIDINTRKSCCTVVIQGDYICAHDVPRILAGDRYLATKGLAVHIVRAGRSWCAMCKNPIVRSACMCNVYRTAILEDEVTIAASIMSRDFATCPPCTNCIPCVPLFLSRL